jgi:hypothetical protein
MGMARTATLDLASVIAALQLQHAILKGVPRLEESGFDHCKISIREVYSGQILRSASLSHDDILTAEKNFNQPKGFVMLTYLGCCLAVVITRRVKTSRRRRLKRLRAARGVTQPR